MAARGDAAAGHDVLVLEVVPQSETQYDHFLGPRNALGQLEPCGRTSFFGGVEEFSLFDRTRAGPIRAGGPRGGAAW